MRKTHLLYRKENCLIFRNITSSMIQSISEINAGRSRIEWPLFMRPWRAESFPHRSNSRVDFFTPMESSNIKISRLTRRMNDQGQPSPGNMRIRTIGSFEMTDSDKSVAQWEPMPNVTASFWYSDASRPFCCSCEASTLFVRDEAIRTSRFVRGSRAKPFLSIAPENYQNLTSFWWYKRISISYEISSWQIFLKSKKWTDSWGLWWLSRASRFESAAYRINPRW
jgi:hypothetical protein